MIKNHNILVLAVAITCFLFVSNAKASSLIGVEGTLANISASIDASIMSAQKTFEELGGKNISEKRNMLSKDADKPNPYLQHLIMLKNYQIILQLRNNTAKVTEANKKLTLVVPVDKALLGKIFIFVPVYNKGDEVLNSWSCITDADKDVEEFISKAAKYEGRNSYVIFHTKNPYLTNCIYTKNLALYLANTGVVQYSIQK